MIEYIYKDCETIESAYAQLAEITRLLRTPEGCPWDNKQTSLDYAKFLIDETYEYLDAIFKNDRANRGEEIGDLLTNLTFLLQIEEEKKELNLIEVINEETQKLIRRHPHVFSKDIEEKDSDQVLKIWDDVKTNVEGRKSDKDDFFSRVPHHLPLLLEASEIQKKAHKVGFDWNDTEGIYDKIQEEVGEIKEAVAEGDKINTTKEIGDLLFSVVNLARKLKVDPELALHSSNLKFRNRFNAMASLCQEKQIPLDKEHFEAMDEVWSEVKKNENSENT